MEEPIYITYRYPYIKIIFNFYIMAWSIMMISAISVYYLKHHKLDIGFIEIMSVIFLFPFIFSTLSSTLYMFMIWKVKSIKIYEKSIFINNREYFWDDITIHSYNTRTSSSKDNTIIINKDGKAMEEILCYVNVWSLLNIRCEDFFQLLKNIQSNKKVDYTVYEGMVKKHKKDAKSVYIFMPIKLLIATSPFIGLMVWLYFTE